MLPYPTASVLAAEIILVILMAGLEALRLFFGKYTFVTVQKGVCTVVCIEHNCEISSSSWLLATMPAILQNVFVGPQWTESIQSSTDVPSGTLFHHELRKYICIVWSSHLFFNFRMDFTVSNFNF